MARETTTTNMSPNPDKGPTVEATDALTVIERMERLLGEVLSSPTLELRQYREGRELLHLSRGARKTLATSHVTVVRPEVKDPFLTVPNWRDLKETAFTLGQRVIVEHAKARKIGVEVAARELMRGKVISASAGPMAIPEKPEWSYAHFTTSPLTTSSDVVFTSWDLVDIDPMGERRPSAPRCGAQEPDRVYTCARKPGHSGQHMSVKSNWD